MSTLFLTSSGLVGTAKEEFLKALSKPIKEIKIASVITASKVYADPWYHKDNEAMRQLGFSVEDIDIEGKNEEELRIFFADKDVTVVHGGNTFLLMKYVRESGFDKVIKEFVERGGLYIGISAGSMIVGSNIDCAIEEEGDENSVGLTDMTGMNFVDMVISPHYKEADESAIVEFEKRIGKTVTRLRDGEVILVKDDNGETNCELIRNF